MKHFLYSASFLSFLFSCSVNNEKKLSSESREGISVHTVSFLQKQADCVTLSQQKIDFKDYLDYLVVQINENRIYLQKNFNIIKDFIETEADQNKKLQINLIYHKLLSDILEKEVSITLEDTPSVFETLFSDFPNLSDRLFQESNKSLAFYNLHHELNITLSTGVNYNRVFSTLEKNIESLSFQNEQTSRKFQDFIFRNLLNYIKHDCFCIITAEEFINRSTCAEIIFQ